MKPQLFGIIFLSILHIGFTDYCRSEHFLEANYDHTVLHIKVCSKQLLALESYNLDIAKIVLTCNKPPLLDKEGLLQNSIKIYADPPELPAEKSKILKLSEFTCHKPTWISIYTNFYQKDKIILNLKEIDLKSGEIVYAMDMNIPQVFPYFLSNSRTFNGDLFGYKELNPKNKVDMLTLPRSGTHLVTTTLEAIYNETVTLWNYHTHTRLRIGHWIVERPIRSSKIVLVFREPVYSTDSLFNHDLHLNNSKNECRYAKGLPGYEKEKEYFEIFENRLKYFHVLMRYYDIPAPKYYLRYEDFISNPESEFCRLASFLDGYPCEAYLYSHIKKIFKTKGFVSEYRVTKPQYSEIYDFSKEMAVIKRYGDKYLKIIYEDPVMKKIVQLYDYYPMYESVLGMPRTERHENITYRYKNDQAIKDILQYKVQFQDFSFILEGRPKGLWTVEFNWATGNPVFKKYQNSQCVSGTPSKDKSDIAFPLLYDFFKNMNLQETKQFITAVAKDPDGKIVFLNKEDEKDEKYQGQQTYPIEVIASKIVSKESNLNEHKSNQTESSILESILLKRINSLNTMINEKCKSLTRSNLARETLVSEIANKSFQKKTKEQQQMQLTELINYIIERDYCEELIPSIIESSLDRIHIELDYLVKNLSSIISVSNIDEYLSPAFIIKKQPPESTKKISNIAVSKFKDSAPSPKELFRLEEPAANNSQSIIFHPRNSGTVLIIGNNKMTKAISLPIGLTGTPKILFEKQYSAKGTNLNNVDYSPSGAYFLVTNSILNYIVFCDSNTGNSVSGMSDLPGLTVAKWASENEILVGYTDGVIKLYKITVSSGAFELIKKTQPFFNQITTITVDIPGKVAYVGNINGRVSGITYPIFNHLWERQLILGSVKSITTNRQFVAAGGFDHSITIFDSEIMTEHLTFSDIPPTVLKISYSFDGRRMLVITASMVLMIKLKDRLTEIIWERKDFHNHTLIAGFINWNRGSALVCTEEGILYEFLFPVVEQNYLF